MPRSKEELQAIRKYGTETQQKYIDAVLKVGTVRGAAREKDVDGRTVSVAIDRAAKKAAKHGVAIKEDVNHPTPEGFEVSGVSTLYSGDGEQKLQWVKTKQEKEQLLRIAIEQVEEVFRDKSIRVAKIGAPTKKLNTDLLIAYPMGDPHIGMYAWEEESGDDFDLEIAERNLVEATTRLVECAPNAKEGLIVNVGDFYHADNQLNRTSRSGNPLDVDTRWAKVLRVGVRAMRACIEAALRKHERVYVINEIGNHDDHTAQVLTLALAMAYENNPRVKFDDSPARFHYHRHGKVLIGVTHGDMVKPERLGEIMATDQASEWGDTVFRYWYTGHIHTRKVFELPGCMVESFRTLAAKDAWTAGAGYRTGRDMYAIALDKEYGEIERHRVDIRML